LADYYLLFAPTTIPQIPKTKLTNKYPPGRLMMLGKAKPQNPTRNKITPVTEVYERWLLILNIEGFGVRNIEL